MILIKYELLVSSVAVLSLKIFSTTSTRNAKMQKKELRGTNSSVLAWGREETYLKKLKL